MHVCLVTPYPTSDETVLGGVEAASLRLTQALLARGVKVTIVAPSDASSVEQRGEVEIHWTRSGPDRLPGILRYWTTERRALHKAIARVGADVVHVQAIAGWGIGLDGPRVLQMHGVPEDAVLHTRRRSRQLSRAVHVVVERLGRRSFPVVAVVSHPMLERFAPQVRGEIVLAENTVPDSYFDIERTPVRGRILFGGIVSHRKNAMGVLQTVQRVAASVPEVGLHLAGDTTSFAEYSQECRQFTADAGISQNVTFLGPVSIERMRVELAEAEVLMLPSFSESAPIIICEAMAAGVPVVASRRDGMVTMIDDGVTGYLVEPDDVHAMHELVQRLITDPGHNQLMGQAARTVAAKRFSGSVLAATMVACYEKVLGVAKVKR